MSSSAFGTLWVYVRRKRLQTGFWEFVTRNQKAWPDTFTDGTLLLYDEDAKTITVVTRDPFKSWPGLCLAEESVRLSVMPSVRQDHCVVLEKSLICLTTSTESELRMEVMGLDVEGEINQKFQAADLPILVDSHSFM
ncbi:MAG: hypothetical protein M1835_001488 [Candelina submexicana]|nr:MAG: hypothetical protein M1835_001488 [Candelina submexicana]